MPEVISIVVPVYNAERTLNECVDSILSQTYSHFELLLVDDGSTDKSGVICDAYAAKDSRVRVFHKPNGGVSSARNLGIDNILGGYLTFVDSDDYVDRNYLLHLIEAFGGNMDLVVGGYQSFGDSRFEWRYESKCYEYAELSDCFGKHIAEMPFTAPWSKLYRMYIIQEYHIRFDTRMKCAEDACFNKEYLCHVRGIALIPYSDYFYYSVNSSEKYGANGEDCVYGALQTIRKYEQLTAIHSFDYQHAIKAIISIHGGRFYAYQLNKSFSLYGFKEFEMTYHALFPYLPMLRDSGGRVQKIYNTFITHDCLVLAFVLVRLLACVKIILNANLRIY